MNEELSTANEEMSRTTWQLRAWFEPKAVVDANIEKQIKTDTEFLLREPPQTGE